MDYPMRCLSFTTLLTCLLAFLALLKDIELSYIHRATTTARSPSIIYIIACYHYANNKKVIITKYLWKLLSWKIIYS